MLDELIDLRKYIENMARSVTLTSLASPVGSSYGLTTNVPDEFNYGIDVLGLITRQYYMGKKQTGDICKFGVTDYADMVSYWSGAANGDREALEIFIEFLDGSVFRSDKLFIHEWSNLRPKGLKNPYLEYLLSPKERIWYRYALVNPHPEKEIRYITFRDVSEESAVRIANVLHYVTRVRQFSAGMDTK